MQQSAPSAPGVFQSLLIGLCLIILSGCLVSSDPVLDARSGKAQPLSDGDYLGCTLEGGEEDCELFHIRNTDDGRSVFLKQQNGEIIDSDQIEMRFRKISRHAYAAQSREDDTYMYYYAKRDDRQTFVMIIMLCPSLPEGLRDQMIKRGDLFTEDQAFETCTVKTKKGLVDAARAYHRGKVDLSEHLRLRFTRRENEQEQG